MIARASSVLLSALLFAGCDNQTEGAKPTEVSTKKEAGSLPKNKAVPQKGPQSSQVIDADIRKLVASANKGEELGMTVAEYIDRHGIENLADLGVALMEGSNSAASESTMTKFIADCAEYWILNANVSPPDLNAVLAQLTKVGLKVPAGYSRAKYAEKFLDVVAKNAAGCKFALDYYLSNSHPDNSVGNLGALAGGEAIRNGFAGTLNLVQKARDPKVTNEFTHGVVMQWVHADPESASKYIRDVATGNMKQQAIQAMVDWLIMKKEFDDAEAWLPLVTNELQPSLKRTIADERVLDSHGGNSNP